MKVAATYIDASGSSRRVWLSGHAESLVIEDQGDTRIKLKWPLAHLRETTLENGGLQLQWPPGAEKLEIEDQKALNRVRWARQLPSRAHKSSPMRALKWIGLAVIFPYLLVELSAFTVRVLPRKWEKKIFGGTNFFSNSELCGIKGNEAKVVLNKLVSRIYPLMPDDREFSVEVNVVKRKEKNAFTFPGGQIYVLEQLLEEAKSSEELAGVLAHEIEHVRNRHATRSAVRKLMLHGILGFFFSLMGASPDISLVDELMGLQFSRGQEREADEGAVVRLRRAHVSTIGFKEFFERKNGEFKPPEFLSTHPSDSSRAELAKQSPDIEVRPVLSEAEWQQLRGICK